ncbi:MAG: urease accessory protein UreE [Pseudomonadota bacterium]
MDELLLEAYQHATAFDGSWQDEVHLVFAEREKARYRTTTTGGQDIGWFLPRGIVLCDGDALVCENKEIILVRAASESLTEASCDDPLLLTRAAYHLGNRHVSLQILPGRLRFPRDHVLEEMLEGLGLTVAAVDDAFSPEAGAYATHSHPHQITA